MSKKVRTLLRVSSKQQLHDDDIPVQRAETEQYIAKRSDWIFDKEYIEKAVSAYKNNVEERAVLQEILADARNHEFDVLLTYMSDRIGRQEEYSFYVATLNQLGIEVWTIKDGQLKTEEHIDKLLNYIRFWQNEGESKKTGMRVRDTQKELVKAGKFVGGKAPYGYQLVPSGMVSNHGRLLKKLEIVEEKAQVVRQIYSLVIHQGMGYEKIAKELNHQSIPAVTTDRWKAGTIRSILTNPVYMGYLAINRRVNNSRQSIDCCQEGCSSRETYAGRGSHKGFVSLDRRDWVYSEKQISELVIVSRQIWEKAQEIREARKARTGASKKKASEECEAQYNVPFTTGGKLALTGLAYCGYCGKRLKNGSYCNHWTTKSGEKKAAYTGRYVCPSKCKERSCYSQNYLEGIVFEVVESYMERLKTVDITEELQTMHSRQRQSVERELESICKKQKALKLDIQTLEEKIPEAIRGDYYFSAEKLSAMIEEKEQEDKVLDKRAQQIKSKLSQMVNQSSDMEWFITMVPNWKEEFQSANTQTKKMLLSSLIDKIEVKDGNINMKFKIRLEDFFLPETIYPGVSEQRLQFHHHLLHRLRPEMDAGQELL